MRYNRLLDKQVERALSPELRELPEVQRLLHAINLTYTSYERDIQLSERAFNITEMEYRAINEELKAEIATRENSLKILKDTISIANDAGAEEGQHELLKFSVLLSQEIEKRKNAERILKNVVNNTQMALRFCDRVGETVYINKKFHAMFNIPGAYDEFNQSKLKFDYENVKINFHNPDKFLIEREKVINDRKIVQGQLLELLDGRYIERSYYPIYENDEFDGNLWTYLDVTDRILSEQKIAKIEQEIFKQKKFTEDVINNLPSDIAVLDKEQNYMFINPQGIKDQKLREWLIGKNDFDYCELKGVDTKLAEKRRNAFLKTIESKAEIDWVDEHTNKENVTSYILRRYYPYFEGSELRFVIGYGVNITEQKKNEIKLEQSLEEIKKINNELEQFAYVASHDLQEPLRTISNFLFLLEKKYAQQLDETARSYIKFAADGARRMRQIILDLLEFSRIGNNDEHELELVKVQDLIEDIVSLHRAQMEEHGATIHYGNLPELWSYRTPIRHVFQNFINNGLKYHKKDVSPIIRIDCRDLGIEWEFSIADNGIGISKQYHEKIFQLFQRLNSKESYSGTGIGLSITKRIIEHLKGRIWLDSEEGLGTTFYFTIPKLDHKN